MSEVKRYTPVVNGVSFIGMAEIGRGGYWAGPDVGPFVPSSDYDALAEDHDEACRATASDLARIAALEAVLRCCLADPRIPTDLWRVIEPALATAETGVEHADND